MTIIEELFYAIEQHDKSKIHELIVRGVNLNESLKRMIVDVGFGKIQELPIITLPLLCAMLLSKYKNFAKSRYELITPDMKIVKILIEQGADIDILTTQPDFSLNLYPLRGDSYKLYVQEKQIGCEDPLLYNGKELAKLFISNCSHQFALKINGYYIEADQDDAISEIYTPLALQNLDYLKCFYNFFVNKLNEDVLRHIDGFIDATLSKDQFMSSLDLTPERIVHINQLIADNVSRATPEELAIQRSYLLRDKILANKIFHAMMQKILPVIDDLEHGFNLIRFQDEFIEVFASRVRNNRHELSQEKTLQKIQDWCEAIAKKISRDNKKISLLELKKIFTIILRYMTGDLNNTEVILEALGGNIVLQEALRKPLLEEEASSVSRLVSKAKDSLYSFNRCKAISSLTTLAMLGAATYIAYEGNDAPRPMIY